MRLRHVRDSGVGAGNPPGQCSHYLVACVNSGLGVASNKWWKFGLWPHRPAFCVVSGHLWVLTSLTSPPILPSAGTSLFVILQDQLKDFCWQPWGWAFEAGDAQQAGQRSKALVGMFYDHQTCWVATWIIFFGLCSVLAASHVLLLDT